MSLEARETSSLSRDRLIRGKGFQEILRHGWRACREVILQKTSYVEWIEAFLGQRSAKREVVDAMPPWIIEERNLAAFEKALALSEKLQTNIGKGKDHPAFAWQEGTKKLYFQARKQFPREQKITRLYMSVPSAQAPDAFRTLCRASLQTGGYEDAKIVLNLENYQGDSLERPFENNTVIVYVYGNDPRAIDRMMQAIDVARKDDPKAWELPSQYQAKVHQMALQELLLPLDDQIAMVEQQGLPESYHHGTYPALYEETFPGADIDINRRSLKEMSDWLRQFSLERPLKYRGQRFRDRYRHLPALVSSD